MTGYSEVTSCLTIRNWLTPSGEISAVQVGFCLRMRLDPLGRKTGISDEWMLMCRLPLRDNERICNQLQHFG